MLGLRVDSVDPAEAPPGMGGHQVLVEQKAEAHVLGALEVELEQRVDHDREQHGLAGLAEEVGTLHGLGAVPVAELVECVAHPVVVLLDRSRRCLGAGQVLQGEVQRREVRKRGVALHLFRPQPWERRLVLAVEPERASRKGRCGLVGVEAAVRVAHGPRTDRTPLVELRHEEGDLALPVHDPATVRYAVEQRPAVDRPVERVRAKDLLIAPALLGELTTLLILVDPFPALESRVVLAICADLTRSVPEVPLAVACPPDVATDDPKFTLLVPPAPPTVPPALKVRPFDALDPVGGEAAKGALPERVAVRVTHDLGLGPAPGGEFLT